MQRIIDQVLELAELYRPSWAGISAAIERSGVPTAHVAEGNLKDKLKAVESELARLYDERAQLKSARDGARDAFASIEGHSTDSEEFKTAEGAVRALGECDERIGECKASQVGLLRMMGDDVPAGAEIPTEATGRPGDAADGMRLNGGWDSNRLFGSDDVKQLLGRTANSKGRVGGVELGQVIGRDALAAEVELTYSERRGQWLGVVPQLRMPLRVIDLIPTGTMDNNVLPYTQEYGTFTTAKGVKEAVTKPEADLHFVDAEAVARTIAHWMKIRKQALADFAALRSIIDSRLRYGIERALEREVIGGKGADPELEGIVHTSGLSVVKFGEGEVQNQTNADQVLRGITNVLLAFGQANGIVMHPRDWQETLMAKAVAKIGTGATGNLQYYGGGPFEVTPQTIWGVPLVPSPAINEGDVLVGDFQMGCQLFIREGVNVLMSDSDQDDFIKNRVTMLAEMRAALAVFRPALFARVFLSKASEEAAATTP